MKPFNRSARRPVEARYHAELPTEYCQPVKLTAAGREVYLLRRDGRAVADVYATRSSLPIAQLAAADSADSVLRVAASLGLRVRRQRALFVNLDAMEMALERLRRATFIPEQAAKAVLDGWHALDDLSRTLGLESPCPTGTSGLDFAGLYDRFFCANTVPVKAFGSVPPAPALERDELDRLGPALRNAWQQVSDRSQQIAAPPWKPQTLAATAAPAPSVKGRALLQVA